MPGEEQDFHFMDEDDDDDDDDDNPQYIQGSKIGKLIINQP